MNSDEPCLLLTAEQVAKRLQVPLATVQNQERVGRLRSVLCGKHKRYLEADVRGFIDELIRERDEE